MANVVTDAETNLIKAAALKKAREIDFTKKFGGFSIPKLMAALGVTRQIEMREGDAMYLYEITGTLQSGNVPEGEIIPLSAYEQTKTKVGEMVLRKYRKGTSGEAIVKSGANVAVGDTDKKMLQDVQKTIRTDFFNFLAGISGTTAATGADLKEVLADSWGKLQVAFEDDDVQPVHFVNPEDIADYLKSAPLTLQNAFGMKYVEDFLGLGRVIITTRVAKGTVFTTAQDNLILYKLTMSGDLARAFSLTTDETGIIGINSGYPTNDRLQLETLVVYGIDLLVEYAAGVIKGTITGA